MKNKRPMAHLSLCVYEHKEKQLIKAMNLTGHIPIPGIVYATILAMLTM